ncbi:Shedu immune nuclease family protein [Tetragenococcus halophilus]|uniref:Shedu immune nuclease family protein n=1 Tax=Tetragenococcus halophilus TaxID=51669 RepID=UPI00077C7BBE|nr:Shedu immune nuclease family protein [Tetragenococcus halophilus]
MQWEKEIQKFLLLIFPKYVEILDEVEFKTGGGSANRRPDFILVDSFGHIDVIEIKTPKMALLRKTEYRNNFVPSGELSSVTVQMENYLHDLNLNHKNASAKIKDKLLRDDVNPKIKLPKGIIIAGDKKGLNDKQKSDFEIIRRQFRNITDIITYDELIESFKNQIRTLQGAKEI